MPRAARLDTPRFLHQVTIRGIERRKIFRTDGDRENMLERLATLRPATGTACYAWAFLDNHAHFLVRSGSRGTAVVMRRLLTGYVVVEVAQRPFGMTGAEVDGLQSIGH